MLFVSTNIEESTGPHRGTLCAKSAIGGRNEKRKKDGKWFTTIERQANESSLGAVSVAQKRIGNLS